MTPTSLATGLFVVTLLFVFAPYWWRRGWWHIPTPNVVGQLRQRQQQLVQQIEALEFDGQSGTVNPQMAYAEAARRQLEIDRLVQQLAKQGGMRPTVPAPIRHNRTCEECGAFCRRGDRFCPQCGGPLKPPPPTPTPDASTLEARKKIVRLHGLLLLIGVALWTRPGFAEDALAPVQPPHAMMDTITIRGWLRASADGGDARVMPNLPFTVEVRTGDNVLVQIAKQTDATGAYEVKNILPHRALAYFVLATIDGQPYTSLPLPVPDQAQDLSMDLVLLPAAAAGAASASVPATAKTDAQRAQRVSVALCALVVVGLFWQWRLPKRKALARPPVAASC